MNIAVISYKNIDVSEAIEDLAEAYSDKNPRFLLPVMVPLETFTQSVLRGALENKTKVTCFFESAVGLDHILKQADDISLTENPIGEVLHTLKPGDAIALVWDDSPQLHAIVHGLEDLALDTWNISEGLESLELDDFEFSLDNDAIREEMLDTMGRFIDLMCNFVGNMVMASIADAVAERIMFENGDDDKKDIDPFKKFD